MAGYVSSFATGAAIEAALNKANNSQSALNATQLKAVNSGADSAKIEQIATNTDDIAINRAELVELVDSGNKNLLEITAEDKSASGVTFTVDKTAGTVTVNSDGTNTASVFFYLRDRADSALKSELMNKTVVLSGCPEGGSDTTYRLRCWHYDGTNIASDYGEGVEFTFTAEDDYDVTIQVYPGAVMDNVVFKPMICTKAAWDISKEFMPYIPKGSIIDTLWSSSSGATVGTEYTMDGNINDYDLVCVKIGTPNDIQQSNLYTQLTFAVAGYISGERISWEGFLRCYCHMSFSGDKFTLVASDAENENSGYKPTVYEIIGIKFGTGTSNNTSTGIKTLTYTGDGLATTTIAFPETPTVILSIDGPGTGTGMVNLASFRYGANAVSGSWSDNDSGSTGDIALRADYSGDTLLLTKGQNAGARCNVQGATYTVMYM